MENSNLKKRVYFLGAGASSASEFNLPTMSEFFLKEDSPPEDKDKKYPKLQKFIERYFPKTPISKLNLEEVITRLELSMDKFGAFGEHPETYLYDARREFSQYVHERLTYQPIIENGRERRWCKKHKDLFEQLSKRDSIITLNYDMIIDHTLFEISPKYDDGDLKIDCLLGRMYFLLANAVGFTIHHGGDTGLGYYLKLHGSIDWLYCPNPTCVCHQSFFHRNIDSIVAHHPLKDLCHYCGLPLVSVIIPPTMNKTFIEYPRLGLLWSLAYREIWYAEELVLIGMSLPDSDYYLKWLINSAIRSRKDKPLKVVVVNKDEKVCDKIYELSGIISEYWNDFCEYVESIKK